MIVADGSWIVALRDPLDTHHSEAAAINDVLSDERALLHPVTFAECLAAAARRIIVGASDRQTVDLR